MIESNTKTWAGGWYDRSDSLAKFAPAFLKLQGELEPVKKDADNPFFRSKYAELSSIQEAVQPLLTKYEFMIFQEPGNLHNMLALTTTLMHVSGEYVRSTVAFPVSKQDPQGYGSAITYARRYALQSILGLPVVDDDGAAASGTSGPQGSKASHPTPPPRPPAVKAPSAAPAPVIADNLPPKEPIKPSADGLWYYNVPFKEKDDWNPVLKRNKARWNPDNKHWESRIRITGMDRYLTQSQRAPIEQAEADERADRIMEEAIYAGAFDDDDVPF